MAGQGASRPRSAASIARLPPISQPLTLADALSERAARPDAVVVAGGTGVMVERNAGRGADAPLLDLSRVAELRAVEGGAEVMGGGAGGGTHVGLDGRRVVRVGAGVTYTRAIEELAGPLPGVAAACRTVASRTIRNRATLAGALVLADPSADVLAALTAAGAEVELSGPDGTRRVAVEAFVRGPGDPDLRPDELVVALLVPEARGPVAYAKAGARNAMARAVCGVAVELDRTARTVRIAIVGAGPTAVRAREAEHAVAEGAPWDGLLDDPASDGRTSVQQPGPAPLDEALLVRAGALVAAAVAPDADERGSAAHRRHVAGVLARRALARAWSPPTTAANVLRRGSGATTTDVRALGGGA